MVKNFIAMPWVLKLMTMSAFSVLGFLVGSVTTTSPMVVFGQPLTVSEWWGSGAGLLTVGIAIIGSIAGVLMLKRSQHARPAYILTWIAASASIPLVANFIGKNLAGVVPATAFDFVVTALIGLYLYRSQVVRDYFHVATG